MEPTKVSKKLLNRLPIYLNHLKSLPEHSENISATAIAKALELGDVQVRKDLAKISHAGRRRTGRNREQLIQDIETYLNFAAKTCTVIVGSGKLGQALLDYGGFDALGLNVMAGFDIIPEPKHSDTGKPIYPMSLLETYCKHYNVRIGIITVPAESAQTVCDQLVTCGVKAIWNFAPAHLNVPKNVVVQSVNLAVSLASLRMQIQETNL